MYKKAVLIILLIIIMSFFDPFVLNISADKINPEVADGVYHGYDLKSKMIDESYTCGNQICWGYRKDENQKYYLVSKELVSQITDETAPVLYGTIKVPDSINGKVIRYIKGSSYVGKFDLNPKNKYMKCIDNVIFSKDGKKLMSFPMFDERREYTVPEGTQIICEESFLGCENLRKINIPDSVKVIEPYAFSDTCLQSFELPPKVEKLPACFCGNTGLTKFTAPKNSGLKYIDNGAFELRSGLEEVVIPSFSVRIDRGAFGYTGKAPLDVHIVSYDKPLLTVSGNTLKWDNIPEASYYEIYQRLDNGNYKILAKTKKTNKEFKTLNKGKKYTFAVKPIAIVPAANYNAKEDKGHYPENFTIEGTMSGDITVTGKYSKRQ